jgi:hypothetical protein
MSLIDFTPGAKPTPPPEKFFDSSPGALRVTNQPMRSNSRHIAFAFALLSFCRLVLCPASAEDGFVSLFNGEDLSGWVSVATPDAFRAEKGAILSTGASPYPSWLRTERP